MRIWHFKERPKMFGLNAWEKRNWDDDESTQETQQTQTSTINRPAEAEAARGTWFKTLQDWGVPGAGYGAVLPNYDEIYQNAAKRINQYYWGSPSALGLIDRVRAGAARRGVAESPAIDVLTQRTGVEQANKLGDLSVATDVTKANAVEQARTNWLQSLMNLSNMTSGSTGTSNSTTTVSQPSTAGMDLLGSGIGLAASLAMGNPFGAASSGMGLLSGLSSMFGNKTPSSLTDRGVTSAFSSAGDNWMSSLYNPTDTF